MGYGLDGDGEREGYSLGTTALLGRGGRSCGGGGGTTGRVITAAGGGARGAIPIEGGAAGNTDQTRGKAVNNGLVVHPLELVIVAAIVLPPYCLDSSGRRRGGG